MVSTINTAVVAPQEVDTVAILMTPTVDRADLARRARGRFSLAKRHKPGVVLCGIEVCEAISQVSPDTARGMLTGFSDLESVVSAINRRHVRPMKSMKFISLACFTTWGKLACPMKPCFHLWAPP